MSWIAFCMAGELASDIKLIEFCCPSKTLFVESSNCFALPSPSIKLNLSK